MYSHLASFWIYVLALYYKFRPKPPYYVRQHREETSLSRVWLNLPKWFKRTWLDVDLYFHNLSKRIHRWYNKKNVWFHPPCHRWTESRILSSNWKTMSRYSTCYLVYVSQNLWTRMSPRTKKNQGIHIKWRIFLLIHH